MEPIRQSTSTIKQRKTTKKTSTIVSQSTTTIRAKTSLKSTTHKATKSIAVNSSTRTSVAKNRPGRNGPSTMAGTSDADSRLAPGSYDIRGANFGESTKGFTIGVKREKR